MRFVSILFAAVLLGGCGSDEPSAPEDTATIAIPDLATEGVAVDADDSARNAVAPPEAAPAAGSARAAAAVVRDYFDRTEAGDVSGASLLWDGATGGPGLSPDQFAARVARREDYQSYRIEIGEPGAISAGAGQRYVTVPVRISGTLVEGDRPFELLARIILHRVAAIDGASAAQQRWRIRSADIASPPPGERTAAPPDTVSARYRCEDGSQLDAAFDNQSRTVTLRRDGERIGMLTQQRAASGIWYRGEGFELRGKGGEATLSAPDAPPVDCRAD